MASTTLRCIERRGFAARYTRIVTVSYTHLDVYKRQVQSELLKLWTSTTARSIDIPWKRRNLYSQGLGCLAAVMSYHRASSSDGLLWGIDGQRLAPLMLDLFADRKAAHMVVLGKTGYGKTFFLNTMALRAAALGGYRVVMVDAFENARRMQRAAGAGVNANWLSLDTAINILDIVFNLSLIHI